MNPKRKRKVKAYTRDIPLNVRMSAGELDLLDNLTEHFGSRNRSDYLRQIIAEKGRMAGFEIPERLDYEST